MTGKDLFSALNYVDDELVAEAETYTAHKVIPMRTVRWMGALAACFCLLVCWAVAVQWDPIGIFNGGVTESVKMESNTAAVTEGAMEQETEEETVVEEAEAEEDYTKNGAGQEEAKGSAGGVQLIKDEDGNRYLIFAEAFPIFRIKKEILDANPQNGTLTVAEELQKTVGQCSIANFAGIPRFLVAFDLYRDEEKIDPNSAEYAAEVQRLASLGYEFRTLYVKQRDKSVKVQVCALMTEGLLQEKDLSSEYGYYLYFPENENGSPLDWNNEAQLSGLPTPEDATVTRDYDN